MSRRHVAAKREILPDPKYGDRTLAKDINMVMSRGEKAGAERIVYGARIEVENRGRGAPLELLKQALDNVEPVEVKSRRRRRHLPGTGEVRPNCRAALAMPGWSTPRAAQREVHGTAPRQRNPEGPTTAAPR